MSKERPKRGPYKRYVVDEVPIPKRSVNFYYQSRNEDPTCSRNNENAASVSAPDPTQLDQEEDAGERREARNEGNDSDHDRIAVEDRSINQELADHEQERDTTEDHTTDRPPRHHQENNELHQSDDAHDELESDCDELFPSPRLPGRGECDGNSSQISCSVVPPRMMVNDPAALHEANSSNDDSHMEEERSDEENSVEDQVENIESDQGVTYDIFIDADDCDVIEPEERDEEFEVEPQPHQEHRIAEERDDGNGHNINEQEQGLGILSCHEALLKAIHDEPQFTSPILTEVSSTPAEVLLKLLSLGEQNKLSFKAFVDTARLVNSLFVSPVIPDTQHLLDALLLSSTGLLRYFYCKKCSHSFGKVDHERIPVLLCPDCKTSNEVKDLTKATYFVLFPIDSQLELLFMDKEVRENLIDPKDAVRRSERNILKDVYDGKCYKEFAATLPNNLMEKVLSCVLCTDGSPLFKSSNYSIWPCFLCINELPPLIRMKNLLLVGLWFGNRHPPMDLYLKPIVDHLVLLSHGFKITVDGGVWQLRLYTIASCVDSGARGAVQGINSHSGYYSCNWCLIPGKWLDKVVFPFQEVAPEPRTHDGLIEHAKECLNNDDLIYVYGVQYASPLVKLPKFDIVSGMVQDFPHNVPFGIARTFLDEWLHNSKRSFYIGSPDELSVLNKRMNLLAPCIEVRRPVRALKDMAYWKAREFENWILFYSLIIILDTLPEKFWTHWSWLVQAVYLLSRECISTENVNTAHRLIKNWVADVERLYAEKYMSFNVHIFSHLAENVSRWGPSWAVSTYCFESAIGKLKNILHAQRGVPHQVHREISYKQAKNILMQTCQTPRIEMFLESIKSKPNKRTKYLSLEECVVIGKGDDFVPNDEESFLMSRFDIDQENCASYSKIIASRCVYTCDTVAVGKKFNNSVALTTSDSIVIIKKFIMDKTTDKVYLFCVEAACEEFLKFPQGIRVLPQDHCVRIISSIGRRIQIISVTDLKIVCVMTKMEENMYVTPFHNLYNVC